MRLAPRHGLLKGHIAVCEQAGGLLTACGRRTEFTRSIGRRVRVTSNKETKGFLQYGGKKDVHAGTMAVVDSPIFCELSIRETR